MSTNPGALVISGGMQQMAQCDLIPTLGSTKWDQQSRVADTGHQDTGINLLFFCFFLSLGGSLRALMIRAEAEGTTSIWACLFWMVSFTVILRPFQSPVALAMSSPTFLGDRPRGPILGAKADVAPTSPPVHLKYT